MEKVDNIARALARFITNSPVKCIIASLILFTITTIGILKIESSFSVKVWLQDNDQRIKDIEKHEASFGSSDTMDIVFYNKNGVFNKETIKVIQEVTEKMWEIKDIVRVESITNYNWIDTEEDEIIITPFLDEEVSLEDENLVLLKEKSNSDKQIYNNFLSRTGNVFYIRSFLKTYERTPPYGEVVRAVEDLVSKYQTDDLKIYLSGVSFINESLNRASDRDMKLVFPIVFVILFFILAYFFKNFLALCFPFALILLTIASTFGLEGHIGLLFNNIISAVPAVLIAIGLADSIHILITYRHNVLFEKQENVEAARNALIKNFIPTILTTITTCVGFFSLTTTDIRPIHDLGLLSGLGTMLAWVYTYFFLGPLLKFITFKNRKVDDTISQMSSVYGFCYKYKNYINISMPILAIVMVYLGTKNYINADPVEYFTEDSAVKKTFGTIGKEFGGSRVLELVFDSENPEGLKDPKFLKNSDAYIKWLLEQDYIIRVTSIVQVLKKMNQTLNNGKEDFYTIANSKKEIADQLFLYTLGLPDGMDLKNQITLDNRKFRAILLWDVNDTMNAIKKTDIILNKAKEFGIKVYEGGQSPIYNRINDLVVITFFKSMSLSIPIIFLIMLLVFKDLKLALLSLIPNLFPLSIASGLMYLNGDEINIGNVIVFSVCLGIAVDDTIHFIANYKIKLTKGMSVEESLRSTIAQTGKALVLTTILLCFAFGLFVLGEFIPNQKFGIYCSIILLLALFADLVILPAILIKTEKAQSQVIASSNT